MAGLATVQTNIVSEFAVEELELGGLGRFIGATDDDTINSTAAREFAHIFGKPNSYQLAHADVVDSTPSQAPSERLLGRSVFAPALTLAELQRRIVEGHVVKRTRLTEDFPLDAFEQTHPEAVIMFVMRQGRLTVVTEKTDVPRTDVTLVAMVPGTVPARTVGSSRRTEPEDVPEEG